MANGNVRKHRVAQQDAMFGDILGEQDRRTWFWHRMDVMRKPIIAADWAIGATQTTDESEELELLKSANADWLTIGTNATSALVTGNARGGFTLTTAGAADDTIGIRPNNASESSTLLQNVTFATDDEIFIKAVVVLPATLTNLRMVFGFGLTAVNIDDTDFANDADAAWIGLEDSVSDGSFVSYVNEGTDSNATVSTVSSAASTIYELGVRVNADRKVMTVINGVVGQSYADSEKLDAGVDLIPILHIGNDDAAVAVSIDVLDLIVGKRNNA